MKYFISQLPVTNPNIFRSYDEKTFDYSNYVAVWEDDCEKTDCTEDFCETLFEKFNLNHPQHYAGHSMSVSDIIVFVNNNALVKTFYCNSIGFEEINIHRN